MLQQLITVFLKFSLSGMYIRETSLQCTGPYPPLSNLLVMLGSTAQDTRLCMACTPLWTPKQAR